MCPNQSSQDICPPLCWHACVYTMAMLALILTWCAQLWLIHCIAGSLDLLLPTKHWKHVLLLPTKHWEHVKLKSLKWNMKQAFFQTTKIAKRLCYPLCDHRCTAALSLALGKWCSRLAIPGGVSTNTWINTNYPSQWPQNLFWLLTFTTNMILNTTHKYPTSQVKICLRYKLMNPQMGLTLCNQCFSLWLHTSQPSKSYVRSTCTNTPSSLLTLRFWLQEIKTWKEVSEKLVFLFLFAISPKKPDVLICLKAHPGDCSWLYFVRWLAICLVACLFVQPWKRWKKWRGDWLFAPWKRCRGDWLFLNLGEQVERCLAISQPWGRGGEVLGYLLNLELLEEIGYLLNLGRVAWSDWLLALPWKSSLGWLAISSTLEELLGLIVGKCLPSCSTSCLIALLWGA